MCIRDRKKAVLLPEQDCFLRILQILLIGVIALDGVEHVALEVLSLIHISS